MHLSIKVILGTITEFSHRYEYCDIFNTGAYSGIGFAVPSNIIKKSVPSLIAKGSYQHPRKWIDLRYAICGM
jgi:hypothetical protein